LWKLRLWPPNHNVGELMITVGAHRMSEYFSQFKRN
jgi:hypothetical protein